MSTLVTGYKNTKDLLLKGAPDRIIDKCISYMRTTDDGQNDSLPFTEEDKKKLIDKIDQISAQGGLRCLAIAEVPNAYMLSHITKENSASYLSDISKYNDFEKNATFLGVVCIKDPVRPEVAPAIADC
jgi:magnesium-transporting ATPase (P-type)